MEQETFEKGTVVSVAGEFWILQESVRAKKVEEWKCPHCGGTETWFDRSFILDRNGVEIEPMCDRCSDCGRRV